MRVVVLADTHAPRRWKSCPPAVAGHLAHADAILHLGDVCTAAVLDELAAFAPTYAVLGNNDCPDVAAWGAPERRVVELSGLRIGMVHDSGTANGRGPRLRGMFPDAAVVAFGHSHIPWDERYDGQRQFNPGSPTDRRRQPRGTIGVWQIEDGRLDHAEIVPVT